MKLAYELSRRAGLAIVTAFFLSGAGHAADVTIRFSTAAPPSDFLTKSLDSFKTEVEAANIGVKVETHPASTLFRQGTEVPALQRANLEMSTMTTFEVAQQIPDYGMFNRAYLFRDYDHLRRVFDGPIGEGYRQRYRGPPLREFGIGIGSENACLSEPIACMFHHDRSHQPPRPCAIWRYPIP